MGFKTILGFVILILDTILIITIISVLGIKNFALFSLGYVLSIFLSALLIGIFTKGLNPDEWKRYTAVHAHKWSKAFYVVGIILIGLGFSYLFKMYFFMGMITGFFVDFYIIFYFKELLDTIMIAQTLLEDMLKKRYKWLK